MTTTPQEPADAVKAALERISNTLTTGSGLNMAVYSSDLLRDVGEALAALDAAPKCQTCNGRGEIGWFEHGLAPGYVTERCPDCNPRLAALDAAPRHLTSAEILTPLPKELDRDHLGELVRLAWTRWAFKQPNCKPSWLVPYADLSEPDKEVDRQIGEAVAQVAIYWERKRAKAAALDAAPAAPLGGGEGLEGRAVYDPAGEGER